MEFYEAVFMLGFLSCLALLFMKVYNAVKNFEVYQWAGAVLSFIGYFIAWVCCLVVVLHYPEDTLYSTLLHLVNWCIVLNVLFFICEVVMAMKAAALDGLKGGRSRERYAPVRE